MLNPYITDRPLTDGDIFFGREDYFTWLLRDLEAGRRLFLLFGMPFIGKTSFTNQLDTFFRDRFAVRHVTLEAGGEQRVMPMWALLTGLAEALEQEPPDRETFEAQGVSYAHDYVRPGRPGRPERLSSALTGPGLRLVPGSRLGARPPGAAERPGAAGGLAVLMVVQGPPSERTTPPWPTSPSK